MQPSLNTWTVLLLFAAAQGLFLALVLFTQQRGNRRANRVLALLILLFSLRLVETVGYWTKYLLEFPHFWLTTASFSFLFGTLLYFYAKFLTVENLKPQDLAQKLDIPTHHLSQIINEKLGQNFFDFLNQYRVEEAKKYLTDPEKQPYTILSIALEVGFNNKASFNTAFKKHTGMTPSHFRDSRVKADKV